MPRCWKRNSTNGITRCGTAAYYIAYNRYRRIIRVQIIRLNDAYKRYFNAHDMEDYSNKVYMPLCYSIERPSLTFQRISLATYLVPGRKHGFTFLFSQFMTQRTQPKSYNNYDRKEIFEIYKHLQICLRLSS